LLWRADGGSSHDAKFIARERARAVGGAGAGKNVLCPAIKWEVAGVVEALINKLQGKSKIWERDWWDTREPYPSYLECEAAVYGIVKERYEVVTWKCVPINL
jgi:hypothetical protein